MSYKTSHNATVILVTHNMEEIARSVDRIFLLSNGRVIMNDTPVHVFSQTEKLRELGLAAPKAAMIAARLQALGLSAPALQEVYTVEQLRAVLGIIRDGGDRLA